MHSGINLGWPCDPVLSTYIPGEIKVPYESILNTPYEAKAGDSCAIVDSTRGIGEGIDVGIRRPVVLYELPDPVVPLEGLAGIVDLKVPSIGPLLTIGMEVVASIVRDRNYGAAINRRDLLSPVVDGTVLQLQPIRLHGLEEIGQLNKLGGDLYA